MENKFELEDGRIVDMSAALPIMQQHTEDKNTPIKIKRSQAFVATGKAVTDYLQELDIPDEQNNRLVELMVAHVLEAERNGFIQGCDLGVKLGKDLA